MPDERWGETVTAIVVPVAGSEPTAEELIAFARSRLAGYKLPRIVEFVDELPRTPSGKVLKRELRERYARRPRRSGARNAQHLSVGVAAHSSVAVATVGRQPDVRVSQDARRAGTRRRSASARPLAGGTRRSSAPCSTSVGTAIWRVVRAWAARIVELQGEAQRLGDVLADPVGGGAAGGQRVGVRDRGPDGFGRRHVPAPLDERARGCVGPVPAGVAASTRRRTRSGCRAAMCSATTPPKPTP